MKELIDAGLDEVTIALDGMSQETYEKYRVGGKFETVRDGVMTLCRIKKQLRVSHPHVNLQFLIMSHNEHELKTVNVVLVEEEEAKEFLPKDEENMRYRRVGGKLQFKRQKPCYAVFMEVKLHWDGTVSICFCDPNGDYIKGNLFRDRIEDVLFSPEYIEAKKRSLSKSLDICRKCEGNEGSI